jgi:predicted enzyme related to lactoylglutathione lyase
LARVQKFYGDVFGWSFIAVPSVCPETGKAMEAGSKVVMFQHGATHGSFIKLDPELHLSPAMHPNNTNKEKFAVTVTITVESIEETIKKVEEAGGKLYK